MAGGYDASRGVTGICTADRTSITVRGRDYCEEIVGRMSLTAFLFFHVTGRESSAAETRVLDAVLVAIAEHGLAPSVIAARMTFAAAPEALQGAVAAAVLGAGPVVLGAAGEAAQMLAEIALTIDNGVPLAQAAEAAVVKLQKRGMKLPGFGHPLHKPTDPRAQRLIAIAREEQVAGRHLEILEVVARVVVGVWGKPLVLNVQGPIAAIALDLGLPPFLVRAIPIVARTVGVLGHLAEEQVDPIAFHLTTLANQSIRYEAPKQGLADEV